MWKHQEHCLWGIEQLLRVLTPEQRVEVIQILIERFNVPVDK
jgi:hypothetical protein